MNQKKEQDEISLCSPTKKSSLCSSFGPEEFREILRSKNALPALRTMVEKSKSEDVVAEFINAGGTVQELWTVLEPYLNDNTAVNVVLSVLHLLGLKSLSEMLLLQSDVEAVYEKVLSSHLSTINTMLSSVASTDSNRKVTLKLLTVMVSSSNTLAERVLQSLNLKEASLKMLTDSRVSKAAQSLRTNYVRLLVAFLVYGNAQIITRLCEKSGWLTSIFDGLSSDTAENINMLTNALRDKLVENNNVSKSIKIKIFNTKTLNALVRLYNWRGSRLAKSSADEKTIDEIRKCGHALLLSLATSHKTGILFKDRTDPASNQLVISLVQAIDSPWQDELKSELILEIIRNCPSMMKVALDAVKSHLTQPSVSENWSKVIDYITKIITFSNAPESMPKCATDILEWTFPNCVSELMVKLRGNFATEVAFIRHRVISLLLSCLKKVKEYFYKFDAMPYLKPVAEYIFKHSLTAEDVLHPWKVADNDENKEKEENEYLLQLADVALIYQRISPKYFSPIRFKLMILRSDSTSLNAKLAQLVSRIFKLKLGDELFEFALSSLSLALECDNGEDSESALKDILLRTDCFKGETEYEIPVWLQCMSRYPEAGSAILLQAFDEMKSMSPRKYGYVDDSTNNVPRSGLDCVILQCLKKELSKKRKRSKLPDETSNLDSSDKNKSECEKQRKFVEMALCLLSYSRLDMDSLGKIIEEYGRYLGRDIIEFSNDCTSDVTSLLDEFCQEVIRVILSQSEMGTERFIEQCSSQVKATLAFRIGLFYAIKLDNPLSWEVVTNVAKKLDSINLMACLSHGCKVLSTYPDENLYRSLAAIRPLIGSDLLEDYSQLLISHCRRVVKDVLELGKKSLLPPENIMLRLQALPLGRADICILLTALSRLRQTSLIEWKQVVIWLLNVMSWEFLPSADCILNLVRQSVHFDKDWAITLTAFLRRCPHYTKAITADMLDKLLESNVDCSLLEYISQKVKPSHDAIIRYALRSRDDPRNLFAVIRDSYAEDKALDDVFMSYISNMPSTTLLPSDLTSTAYKTLTDFVLRYSKGVTKFGQICEALDWQRMVISKESCSLLEALHRACNCTRFAAKGYISKFLSLAISCEDNINGLAWLCERMLHTLRELGEDDKSYIVSSEEWMKYAKIALKYGLKGEASQVFKHFAHCCYVVTSHVPASLYFEMIASHSEFVNVMLTKHRSSVKENTLRLLLLLAEADSSVANVTHIPLFLAAYNATLTLLQDKLILRMLQLYESVGILVSDYRPYLWGETAATHYGVRSDLKMSLRRQPTATQMLQVLDPAIVENTISAFPIHRSLRPSPDDLKELYKFDDDIEEKEEKLVYDPRWFLPVFSDALSPDSRISVQKFVRSGALSLLIGAASSVNKDVRSVAYHCFLRFDNHLVGRDKEMQLWQHFISALRCGLMDGVRSEDDMPRISCITSVFLSRMCLIVTEPLNTLYTPLNNFLLAKPKFDLTVIPEWNRLLAPSSPRAHKHWILSVVEDGIRCDDDWNMLRRSDFLTMIMAHYTFSHTDETSKAIILRIMRHCGSLETGKGFLVTRSAWIAYITIHMNELLMKKSPCDVLLPLMRTFMSKKHAHNVTLWTLRISHTQISLECLQMLKESMQLCNTIVCHLINLKTLQRVLEACKPSLPSDLYRACIYQLDFGERVSLVGSNPLAEVLSDIIFIFHCKKKNIEANERLNERLNEEKRRLRIILGDDFNNLAHDII